jgi:hypothetical protein
MLSNVFSDVVRLESQPDRQPEARSGVDFTIVPVIVTTSGGSGLFTWPPTNFTVDLSNDVRDATGKRIATVRVVGSGSADTGERLRSHGLAGARAMADALAKMQVAMLETTLPLASAAAEPSRAIPPAASPNAVADRLAQLKGLKEKGVISEAEYEAKRKAILDSL